jgi:hypothetical protein
MITWLPVTLGFLGGVDCGLSLADGMGAALGELTPGTDDVAGVVVAGRRTQRHDAQRRGGQQSGDVPH